MARRLERDEGLAPVGPFGTGFCIRPQYISRARILHASKKANCRDIGWGHAEIGAERSSVPGRRARLNVFKHFAAVAASTGRPRACRGLITATVRFRSEVCEQCRKSYEPRRSSSRFCSQACRQRAYRQRLSVTVSVTASNHLDTIREPQYDVTLRGVEDQSG